MCFSSLERIQTFYFHLPLLCLNKASRLLDISALIWGVFFIPLRDSEGGKKPHCNSVISTSPSSFDQECKGILFCECHFLSGLLYFNFLDVKTGTEDELGIEMRGYEHDSPLLQNFFF